MRFGIMTAVDVSTKIHTYIYIYMCVCVCVCVYTVYIINIYRRFGGYCLRIILVDTEMEAAVCPEPIANMYQTTRRPIILLFIVARERVKSPDTGWVTEI